MLSQAGLAGAPVRLSNRERDFWKKKKKIRVGFLIFVETRITKCFLTKLMGIFSTLGKPGRHKGCFPPAGKPSSHFQKPKEQLSHGVHAAGAGASPWPE